jgi:hypothetical protein
MRDFVAFGENLAISRNWKNPWKKRMAPRSELPFLLALQKLMASKSPLSASLYTRRLTPP